MLFATGQREGRVGGAPRALCVSVCVRAARFSACPTFFRKVQPLVLLRDRRNGGLLILVSVLRSRLGFDGAE